MGDTGSKRVASMLRHLGLLPDPYVKQPIHKGPFPGFGQPRPAFSLDEAERLARVREREALRRQFPSAFPRSSPAPTPAPTRRPAPLTETPRAISKPMQDFLTSQDPSTDWSKVRMRLGGNFPGSYASTNGNMISFSEPLRPGLKTFFHEVGHIPDWQNGSLSIPKYVGEALLHTLAYGAEQAVRADMPPVSLKPEWLEKTPAQADSIWSRISYEQEAEARAERWLKNYYRSKKK